MKILIFLKKWEGGVGVVVKSIKKELEKKGHEVICVSREEDLKCYSSIKNLFWLRKKYIDILEEEKPDIIYTQDWSMALPLIFPFRIFKKKHFCCFHGNQLGSSRFLQATIGKMLGDDLIVVGDSLKERFPLARRVYNGVDMEKFRPLRKKRDCLGWIKKDTEILEEEDIVKLAKRLELKPLIAKNFEIPFDRMNEEFYNKCKIFVSLPPKSAGFNLCWIEAMAAGVPIIIGNEEGVGWRLDIDKFQTKGDFLGDKKELRSKKYREKISKNDLTWKDHIDILLDIWEQ